MSYIQVLRYLVRVIDNEARRNQNTLESKLDLTLLHPPRQEVGKEFYPPSVAEIPEYRYAA